MPKLTIHEQQTSGWVKGWLDRTGAEWVKCIDHYPDYPGKKVIGRTYMPDHESNALVWQGAEGAGQWFYRWLPIYRANPHVFVWEGPNESHPMSNPAFRRMLDEFTAELAFLMHAEGLKLVGMNWSVGWPDIGHAPEFRNSMTELAYRGHYLGIHEYCAPHMWDGEGWYTLRYRKTVQELASAGIPIPQILITECGIDGGVANQPKKGWKTFATEEQYVEQLVWYENELQKDDYVEAAFIFTAGPNAEWWDFEVTERLALRLEGALNNQQPSPSPPSEIKYIWYDGSEVSDVTFRAEFGNFYIEKNPSAKYRIVRLKAVAGQQSFRFYVINKDGSFASHENVVLSWPNAPQLPGSGWDETGVEGPVGEKGYGDHPMGPGAAYPFPGPGPHKAWVYGKGKSDLFGGFGWLMGTQYNHIDVAAMEIDGPAPPVEYHLFVSEEPEEGGFVTREPFADVYEEGTVVYLSAVTNEGWRFCHWSGDAAGTHYETSLVMDNDKAVAAHFVKEEGEIDVPAAIESGYDALRHLGEDV